MRVSKKRQHYEQNAYTQYGMVASDYADRDEHVKWKNPSGTALALETLCSQVHPRRVLELGTGTGRYFPYLIGETYVGVDICGPMLEHARRRESVLRDRGFTKITLIEDEINIFLSQNSSTELFDLVFSIGCIGVHIPVTTDLMGSIQKLLSSNGYLFLQTTQHSFIWGLQKKFKHWRNILAGRKDNYGFYCATTPQSLRKATAATGLKTEWVREDTSRWYDRPILLSLFRNTGA
jgi:SAM-dependent methyltransferase